MNIYTPYAGFGNDDTPPDIVQIMASIARQLNEQGFTARTMGGGAADEAFETNSERVEIHLPWKKFNGKTSEFARNSPDAEGIVRPFHPTFNDMKPAVKAIIARGAHVILGKDLRSPVRFVVCWTADGLETSKDRTVRSGYCGIPIALAASLKIPVYNLKNTDALERFRAQLDS